MTTAGPVLAVDGLSVALRTGGDRRLAVEDVSFSVMPGETVCLVGESGSGKSVTASTIMGLLPPKDLRVVKGSVRLQGEDVIAAPPRRLRELRGNRMSMVFQEPMTALNPAMTIGKQIIEVMTFHPPLPSRAAMRERMLQLMRDVRLPEPERLQHSFPHELSGGQRQRVVIAMALAMKPALIIADEPTTALDVTNQAQILVLLRELREAHNTSVLFITHDLGVVAEIADRIVVMRQGRVVETGDAREVLGRPRHPYTRTLLAAVPRAEPKPPRYSPAATNVLEVRDLSKTYGGGGLFRKRRTVKAVDGVTFGLRRGEILGIVGESGSGKSTLARCISRLVEPSGGRILVSGAAIESLNARGLLPYRRRIQIVFQDPYRSLNPRRTVGQSIIEGPVNFGLPKAEARKRVEMLLELVGLGGAVADRYPHQFSGGQRQRICIARALALEPEVLVADEAVSALDVSVQAQVLDLFEDIRRKLGLAIILITHDLRVAAQLCDTIGVMIGGRMVEYGTAVSVFRAPEHAYTRSLLAAAPGSGLLGAMPGGEVEERRPAIATA